MNKVILKDLQQHRILGGKIGQGLAWPHMRSITGVLSGRWPCLAQSFIVTVLILIVISCWGAGFLAGSRHIEAMTPGTAITSAKRPPINHGYTTPVYSLAAQSSQELIHRLKEFKFWNNTQAGVPPILLAGFPADLKQIDVELKKKTFVHALLPAVLIVRAEVLRERQELLTVINEIGASGGSKFAPGHPGWQAGISAAQILFINNLCRKYRSEETAELLTRVNVLPISLMLAQAAIESSWGSSRFAIQANNLFGMWTWGKRGLVPARRTAGKRHKIAIYNSVIDSVRSYLLTINRLGAYSKLRDIRNHTTNSGAIAEGLVNYSGRKEFYVLSLKRLMKHNNLVDFDKCRLTPPVKIKRTRA